MASYIKHINDTKRKLVTMQHSKVVAELLSANEFEIIQEKIELLSDIQTALNQLAEDEFICHKKAKDYLLNKLPK